LTVCAQQPDRGGYDDDTLAALITSSRQVVADTALALRRMAEGTYGTCERCSMGIPVERLEILPQARFCVSCQRRGVRRSCDELTACMEDETRYLPS